MGKKNSGMTGASLSTKSLTSAGQNPYKLHISHNPEALGVLMCSLGVEHILRCVTVTHKQEVV